MKIGSDFMENKGLVVVYDPHNLYQFIWYYCNKGKDKKWDVLCLPNGYKGEYMHTYCERATIFEHVYRDVTDFSALSVANKFKMMTKMIWYFVTGRRTVYCRRILNKYVNLDEYDELVVIADVGIISGACVALGKEKQVIILEDGLSDYGKRPQWIPRSKWKSSYSWQGFFLSKMGYCSPGWFRLKTDKDCIKYSSSPEKMIYRGYKEIRQLYSEEGTDQVLYDSLLKKIYPTLNDYDFNDADALILTRPLRDYVNDSKKYVNKFERYISDNFNKVFWKRHPREEGIYQFGNKTEVVEIDNSIPAEVLLPYFSKRDVVVMSITASVLPAKALNIKCTVIDFDGLYEESLNCNSRYRPPSKDEMKEIYDKFLEDNYNLINV